MARISFELPDEVAEQAKSVGLLEPKRLTDLIMGALREDLANTYRQHADRIRESGAPVMSEEEVVAEIKAMRKERRAQKA